MNPSSKSQIPQLDTTFHTKRNGAATQPDILLRNNIFIKCEIKLQPLYIQV